jgi:hypothetical protein
MHNISASSRPRFERGTINRMGCLAVPLNYRVHQLAKLPDTLFAHSEFG